MDYKDLQERDAENDYYSSAHENSNAEAFFSENGLASNIQGMSDVARSKLESQNSTAPFSGLARNGGKVPFSRKSRKG